MMMNWTKKIYMANMKNWNLTKKMQVSWNSFYPVHHENERHSPISLWKRSMRRMQLTQRKKKMVSTSLIRARAVFNLSNACRIFKDEYSMSPTLNPKVIEVYTK